MNLLIPPPLVVAMWTTDRAFDAGRMTSTLQTPLAITQINGLVVSRS